MTEHVVALLLAPGSSVPYRPACMQGCTMGTWIGYMSRPIRPFIERASVTIVRCSDQASGECRLLSLIHFHNQQLWHWQATVLYKTLWISPPDSLEFSSSMTENSFQSYLCTCIRLEPLHDDLHHDDYLTIRTKFSVRLKLPCGILIIKDPRHNDWVWSVKSAISYLCIRMFFHHLLTQSRPKIGHFVLACDHVTLFGDTHYLRAGRLACTIRHASLPTTNDA